MRNRVVRLLSFFGALVILGLIGTSASGSLIPERAVMIVMGSGLVCVGAKARRRLDVSR